jgi:hypothetical protein
MYLRIETRLRYSRASVSWSQKSQGCVDNSSLVGEDVDNSPPVWSGDSVGTNGLRRFGDPLGRVPPLPRPILVLSIILILGKD